MRESVPTLPPRTGPRTGLRQTCITPHGVRSSGAVKHSAGEPYAASTILAIQELCRPAPPWWRRYAGLPNTCWTGEHAASP